MLTDRSLGVIAQHRPKLQILHLLRTINISSSVLCQSYQSLESLHVSQLMPAYDADILIGVVPFCAQLRTLYTTHTLFSTHTLMKIAKQCTNLTSLDVMNSGSI